MARKKNALERWRDAGLANPENSTKFTEAALERHKREGMELAVRARWAALAVIAIMLPLINPKFEIVYYWGLLALLALTAWAQRRAGRVGVSGLELFLLFADLAIMTVAILVPNPLAEESWPLAMTYRDGAFKYFYVLLAAGTLAYSWRTVIAIGTWTAALWTTGLLVVWLISVENEALTGAAEQAFGAGTHLAEALNPNNFLYYIRVQEVVVFLLVAITLAISSRRFNVLLLGHAALERERANLARYFSPNVVDELSHNDEPLKQIRTQDIAVLFVDIVGFTRYAADRSPQTVIETLRQFHHRMETEVFRHNGTLDKYLGDGLMATFGTPFAGDADALNALHCARAMMRSVDDWNAERAAAGEPEIRASFGLHYGPAVLGDIGANRLEFAVIGNTINVASRVEALTRNLSVELAATDALLEKARAEARDAGDAEVEGFVRHDDQEVRGLEKALTVWTLDRAA